MTVSKGFILKARKIEDSDIAHASPCTRELWDLILRKANFRDQRCGRTTIRRGQWLTSYEEIQDLLHWRVGFRKHVYSWHQIEAAMKYMRRGSMVTTAKATRGLFITVLNYERYQCPDNYERHTESHNEDHNKATGQRMHGRMIKKAAGSCDAPTAAMVEEYATSIGYTAPDLGRRFVSKYEAAGWCIDGQPMRDWRAVVRRWRQEEKNRTAAPEPAYEDPTEDELDDILSKMGLV